MRVRQVLVALAIAFSCSFVARGVFGWPATLPQPLLLIGCLALYLVVTLLCLFRLRPPAASVVPVTATLPSDSGVTPRVPAVMAVATAVGLPPLVWFAVGPGVAASYATWTVGGVGVLMTILMVGRRPWFAWAGTAAMGVSAVVVLGPGLAASMGLVGSVVWVAVAQLVVVSLDRAAKDTARLAELQQAALTWHASQSGRQRERRLKVQRALTIAGPVLGRTISSGNALTDDDRAAARLAEARLRDELRGPRLLDDDVRDAIDQARRRGAVVTVLDEGGLDELSEDQLAIVRAELAEVIRTSWSPRVYIRSSPHEDVAVTIVGRDVAGGGLSDEDSVDLWHEITRPAAPRALPPLR